MTQSVREAAQTLLLDVQDYPAWNRPCWAVDQLREALARPDPPCPDCDEIAKQRDHYMAEGAKLHEQVAALESREVCTAPHENVEECGYCQRDRLQAECEKLRAALEAWKMARWDEARHLTDEALEGKK